MSVQMLLARFKPLMQCSCFGKNLQLQQGYELVDPSLFHHLLCDAV